MNDTTQQPAVPSPPPPPRGGLGGGRIGILLGLGTAVLLVAVITLVVVLTNDDADVTATTSTTTSTEPSGSSSSTTEDTGASSSTSSIQPMDDVEPVIIADGYLLGYWDGIDWQPLSSEDDGQTLPDPQVTDGTPYLFVDASGGELRTSLGPIGTGCYLGNNWAVFDDSTASRVGIPLGFDALPRTVAQIEPSDAHVAAVRAWLVSQGDEHPVVSIDRVLRVDIEGDGKDEVFIEASMDADGGMQTEPGAYSVLLYRYLDRDDQAQTVVVAGDYVSPDDLDTEMGIAFTHRILGILDLNQDGRLELVTKSGFYEGESVEVSIVYSPNFVTVLSTGCGA